MCFLEVLWINLSGYPSPLLVAVAGAAWIASCVLAINIAFGADSLFMYKQLEYATNDKLAPPIFIVGWLLWPLALLVFYIIVLGPTLWNTIKTNTFLVLWGLVKWMLPWSLVTVSLLIVIGLLKNHGIIII